MAVLYIRDGNGNFVPIPALQGESAYDQAKAGGYQGTQEEFIAFLNGLLNPVSAIGDEPSHADDKNNPHNVTAKQTGAVPEVYYASSDLNTELQQGGNKFIVCCYNSITLNSPYKEGLTVFERGMVITNAHTDQYSTQMCMPTGDNRIFIRRLSGQVVSAWAQVANMDEVNSLFANVNSKVANIDNIVTQVGELQASLASVIAQNTKIATGQYAGAGTFGENNKNSLTFPFIPKIVYISAAENVNAAFHSVMPIIQGCATARIQFRVDESSDRCYSDCIYLSWNDNTLSWHSTNSTYKAAMQLNENGVTYKWVAIG